MELVTRKEAARRAYVTPNLITHWIKIGRIKTYPLSEELKGYNRKYLVDMEEIRLAHKLHDWGKAKLNNPKLLSPKEIAQEFGVTTGTIFSWVRRNNIKKHYVPHHNRFFLLNIDDIAELKLHEFK